jgi:transcription antitermination factor NusG
VFGRKSFVVGDRVRIKNGAFQGLEGVATSINGRVILVAVQVNGREFPTEFGNGAL